eukprot:TRINITY_DN3444_c0_g1_i1.p1 TRINITY_DN3444_c0_g1~~TRINITY_DN3444_c0_g1_i1.p1  ORF type:complete len:626 (+),score=91.01 TRINITY_DN3444_c0_g1_i1:146-1879(+)
MGSQYSSLVFCPGDAASYSEETLPGIQWIEHAFQENRKFPVIFHEWKGRNAEAAYFTILYSSGNTEDMGMTYQWMIALKEALNVNILQFEYSGYGINRGGSKPSERHCYEDICAAFYYLLVEKEIPPERIMLMGKSIGTGPCINLAHLLYTGGSKTRTIGKGLGKVMKKMSMFTNFKQLGGLILQSPMTSVLDLRDDINAHLVPNMFENTKKISKVKCKIFIAHGMQDQVIPSKQAIKLSSYVADGCLWKLMMIEDAGHSNMETEFLDDYLDELINFIDFQTPESAKIQKQRNGSVIPDQYLSSPIQMVLSFLKPIGLEKYAEKFTIAGFYEPLVLSSIMESDLDLIGVEIEEDRKKILSAVKSPIAKSTETVASMSPKTRNMVFRVPSSTRRIIYNADDIKQIQEEERQKATLTGELPTNPANSARSSVSSVASVASAASLDSDEDDPSGTTPYTFFISTPPGTTTTSKSKKTKSKRRASSSLSVSDAGAARSTSKTAMLERIQRLEETVEFQTRFLQNFISDTQNRIHTQDVKLRELTAGLQLLQLASKESTSSSSNLEKASTALEDQINEMLTR